MSRAPAAPGYSIEGHAIVSADDRIAGADGLTPPSLNNPADWARFQAALDDAVLDGRMDAIITMFQGLPVRAVHNPDLDPEQLIASFQLALHPLLFS